MAEPILPVPIPPTGPAPAPPGVRLDRPPSEPETASAAADLPPAGPDEVALLIDGRPAVVKQGTTVLQAAAQIGLIIPHYCYHPGLSVAGNCRMCLVEIERMPKLQIGCATAAAQGMIVRTRTERVRTTRQGIQEFLLINHPLDCPICDQAGECRLQQYEADYGKGYSRFGEEKVRFPKRYAIGRNVVFDAERCIKCTRCIRFCDEISRTGELTLLERGDHTIVGTFPGRPLDNAYSGNTVDICPVGALTWKPFRFKARVWFLRNVPSVCAGCARGCNVDLAEYRNRIHRMTPRVNLDVNRYWMCDEGRMSHQALYDRPRLETPLIRAACASGPLQPGAWEEALDRAAGLLRDVADGSGRDSLAGIVSSRLSVEDLYLAKQVLGEAIGIPRLAVPPHESGEDDDLLIRRDRTPNARGAALVGVGAPDIGRVREILQDVASGRVRGLVVVGEDIMEAGIVPPDALDRLEALVVVDWWKSPTVDLAHVALPACGYGEFDGTLVNFEGRVQRVRAAVKPLGEAEPAWRVLRDLGRRFGLGAEYATASGVFDEVASTLRPFAGLSYRVLGSLGSVVQEG